MLLFGEQAPWAFHPTIAAFPFFPADGFSIASGYIEWQILVK